MQIAQLIIMTSTLYHYHNVNRSTLVFNSLNLFILLKIFLEQKMKSTVKGIIKSCPIFCNMGMRVLHEHRRTLRTEQSYLNRKFVCLFL